MKNKKITGFMCDKVSVTEHRGTEGDKWEEETKSLTKELCGAGVAGGFFIIGESLIDDLSHSSIQTLQFLILRCHS